jgi:competence protein ComEC
LSGTFGWPRFREWIAARRERMGASIAIPAMTMFGILAIVLWRGAFSAPDGRLHLTLLDVGTGDAILIQTPQGRFALINGGPSTSLLSDGLGRRLLPFHRELDWLIVASPRPEEIAGLPRILERFPPEQVLWAGPQSPSRDADYLREGLTSLQIPVTAAQTGQVLDLGSGASLKVLISGDRGAILLLDWDQFRVLLPLGVADGDLESLRMGKDIGQVTTLLLADNGHTSTNPSEWLHNLCPQLVLLSVSADDRDGLPSRETLDALGGYSLLRTDQNGWIQMSTDGKWLWVEVEK